MCWFWGWELRLTISLLGFVLTDPQLFRERLVDQMYCLKPTQLYNFFHTCSHKFLKALMEPG